MSKKILVDEFFIQAAYDAACTDWKEKILKNIPEFKTGREFYKIGDRFKLHNEEYIMCKTDINPNKANLFCLRNGNLWQCASLEIKNSPSISEEEFKQIAGSYNFIPIKS